jgi:hypothetical protein
MKGALRLAAAGLAAALAIALSIPGPAQPQQAAQAPPASSARTRVDLELVLAVDVSQSMDYDEHELQRNGYVEAFRHQDVIRAITGGPEGKIAVMYMEWAGMFDPIPVIPWTIIDSEQAARAFADRLSREPPYSEQRTSISTALLAAANYIETNTIAGHRRVIDVSGDGANNTGPPVEQARDSVLRRGIIVNGLPILLNKPREFYDIDHLDRYYKDCVIGGEGAFIAPVYDLRHLASTIRKKLVMEIASIELDNGAAPVQFGEARPPRSPLAPGVHQVQLRLPTTRTDCMIGERVMGGRGFGGFDDFGGRPPPRR